MKKRFPIYACLCTLLLACTNNQKNPENSTSQDENREKSPPTGCYQYASPDDTIILKLIYVGEAITGTLVYKLKEKDKNIGTIQGRMRGDVLVARYTFMSEGMSSVRQIAFKKQGDYFVEGYGDVEIIDCKTSFKNLDSLQFIDRMKLMAVDCR